ncbi:hypothetical protein Tco_1568723 [Tanacetum coccineum]
MEFNFNLDAAKDVSTAEKDVSTAKPVSTTGAAVTTASVAVSTTASPTRRVSTADDITMAETLVYIRKSAVKDKGKAKMDESESETAQTKTKLQQEQERLGYEAAIRLQAKLEEEEWQRIAKSEIARVIPELAAGSSKRDVEEELDQESLKRQKIDESLEPNEEPKDKEEELSQEELQQMMIIVPEQWMNVEALQTNDAVESDTDDELWKLQKHTHDLTWRLYDSCGVHHVSTEKGIDIYMLVEKEYPLLRGTLTQMLVAKLLVDQDNEMSRELLRKIFM